MARVPIPRIFLKLLVNSLIGGFTGSFLWFAITFWAYLETKSVVVTSVVSGFFGITTALFGLFFGTYVDRHRKHQAMVVSAILALVCLVGSAVAYRGIGRSEIRLSNPVLWV